MTDIFKSVIDIILSCMLKCEEFGKTSCLAASEYLKEIKYPSCSYPKKQMCSDVLLSSVHTSQRHKCLCNTRYWLVFR